jgi:hypothetical protein
METVFAFWFQTGNIQVNFYSIVWQILRECDTSFDGFREHGDRINTRGCFMIGDLGAGSGFPELGLGTGRRFIHRIAHFSFVIFPGSQFLIHPKTPFIPPFHYQGKTA